MSLNGVEIDVIDHPHQFSNHPPHHDTTLRNHPHILDPTTITACLSVLHIVFLHCRCLLDHTTK